MNGAVSTDAGGVDHECSRTSGTANASDYGTVRPVTVDRRL
jgi:hypothetical protein